jgi:hypothetical protein
MTKLCDLPGGTKLLCIKDFVHGPEDGPTWSTVRRLTKGNVYTKAGSSTSQTLGIVSCDAGKTCYWGSGKEHFVEYVESKQKVLVAQLWNEKDDSCQYIGVFATPESLDNYMKNSWANAVAEPNADGFVASYELRGPSGEYLGFDMLITEIEVL